MELRLLTDADYAEEFDIAVNELTDQYVSGEIQGAERERVEKYFLKSSHRRDKLKYASALNTYKSQPHSRKRWWMSTEFRVAASLILVATVSLLFWRQLSRQSPTNDGVLALQTAYRDQRPLEARIFGWNYAPAISLRGAPRVDYVQRDRAANILQNAVNDHRDAKSLHDLGQFYLAERQFDKAIDQFEAALLLSPQDATIHSDLGSALMEKGKTQLSDPDQGKAVALFGKSLTHLTKAIELDNSRLEALFNRALLYNYLGLPDKSEQDWRQYLERDPNSQWSNEAKERLKSLEETRKKTSQTPNDIFDEFTNDWNSGHRESAWKLVRDSQNRSGNVVADRLLDDYLDRGNRYSQHASEAQPLAELAAMYIAQADDRFYSDVYEHYRSATPQQIIAAKEARELMKASHAAWPRADENLRLFNEAKGLFDKAGDVAGAMLAEYWLSFSTYNKSKYDDSLKLLKPLIKECVRRKYQWLYARCIYLRSNLEYVLNQHSKAIASAREGVKLAEKTGDSVGLLNLVSSLVEYYRYVGNYPKSLAQIERGLPIVTSLALDPLQSSRHYSMGANAFASVGFYDAAAEFQEQAVRISERARIEDRVVYQHAFLGTIYGKLGRFADALQHVNKAVEMAGSARNVLAYSLLQQGHIYRAMSDYEKAVDSYGQSIELYNQIKLPARLYEAHKGVLLCYISQNDVSRAEQEIATILPLIEEYRKQISEENNRNSFFETEQNVYDTVIDFEVSRLNNPERAFQYLQYSRGRSLLDLLNKDAEAVADALEPEIVSQSVAQPESAEQIKEKLPEGVQLVQYAVLEDKILIWVISRSEIALKQSNVSRRDLNETIQRYLKVISRPPNDQEEESALAKQLYVSLIQPIEALLDRKRVLCIIPDKNLSYIPFSALISPASQKYLIEDYVITTSQSPSVFLYCSKNATRRAHVKDERLLSVGNPRFDRASFPDLDDLPNAKQEALEIASNYKDALPLLEASATATAVKNEMLRSDVVHFALHSVLDGDLPLRSSLLLTPSGTQSQLHAYEVYRLGLERTRLVVLSSCQTGAERYYDGEGMASLARAFMGAGVPLVVASLWPVDSAATEKLMVRFHSERRQSNTAMALTNAQRAMLHGSEKRFQSPYYWAAFSLNGGYAEF
ncbi:MAG TPA: CHAT domain-containing protein [Pyrinomonadaceae bacterium]|nr:CHAT domain-containing protein [Pyrinomonadaceae bacterium]